MLNLDHLMILTEDVEPVGRFVGRWSSPRYAR